MTTVSDYLTYFNQYLDQLADELRAYPNEESLWLAPAGINNCAGNLAIHLMGNLNHFIGAALGDTGYRRNRELEFAAKEVPREELLRWLAKTRDMLAESLHRVGDFKGPYPTGYRDRDGSITDQLNRLLAHLAYHVGQVNYHRRLLAPS